MSVRYSHKKGKSHVRVLTLPGQESELEKIQNNDLIDIIEEIVNYNKDEMIYQVYIKYIDYGEEMETC